MRRFITLLGLTALIALGSDQALTGTAGNSGGGDHWRFRLRLVAPEPGIQSDPTLPVEGPVLTIPTFDQLPPGAGRTAAGAGVPLPVKVVRVAIPEGGEVVLENIQTTERPLRGLRLGLAKEAGMGAATRPGPTATPEAGEAQSRTEPVYLPVRLGQVGWFRHQRFVEVIYSPVELPGDARQRLSAGQPIDARFHAEAEAEVVVRQPRLPKAGKRRIADPHFDNAYRAAFVNPEDALALRVEDGSRLSSPALVSPFDLATTPVYRVGVSATGIHRLTQSFLTGPGGVAPGLAGADPRTFKLMSAGVEIPIRVVGEGDGSFGPADYIEFFGEGLIGEPEVTTYIDFCDPPTPQCGGFPNIYQANDTTDENAYFLFAEPGPRSRVPALSGTFNPGFPLVTSVSHTAHLESDSLFVPLGFDDPFFHKTVVRGDTGNETPNPVAANCGYSNTGIHNLDPNTRRWLGPGFAGDPNSPHHCPTCEPGQLPGLLNVSDPATVRVRWRGASSLPAANPDHLVVVQVGNTPSNYGATCFDAETLATHTFTVPQSAFAGSGIWLYAPGLAADPAKGEGSFLDFIEVDYRRSLLLNGGALEAAFTDAARSYQVDGFATNVPGDMVVYDISRPVGATTIPSPRLVTGGTIGGSPGNHRLTFSLPTDGVPRRFAMAGAGGFRLPSSVTQVGDDDLLSTDNQADYIAIVSPSAVDTTPGSAFSQYLAHRGADAELTTRVVRIDDIYDQFNHGVAHPQALRTFLAYAFDNWHGPSGTGASPAYVMLVGDATADFNNRMTRADWIDGVPTFVLYQTTGVVAHIASDNAIAAFLGSDQLPDVHIGRIPARSVAASEDLFTRMLDYDLAPPGGTWKTRGVFIADQGNSCGETGGFEAAQEEVITQHFGAPLSATRLYLDDPAYGVMTCGANPNFVQFRNDIVSQLDAGAALTSYIGHGAYNVWGLEGWFGTSHVGLLAPNDKPTFLVNENCLAGGFHTPYTESLGETFFNAPSKGAIAVFAPAGLSFTFTGQAINDQLYSDLFGLTKERRFGNLITNVRLAITSTIDQISYVLLGDPAQRLILPAPRPPRDFTAVGGNAQVALSWTPGPDPGTLTRIYRTENPVNAYTLLTPSGVPGTSYVDSTAINGKTYFYRATSVVAGPFEGAPTNLNSDCSQPDPPSSGPDCRWARPLNPSPPATPAGFVVSNPGNGSSLRGAWSVVPEPDVSHYTLRYGTTPGGPYPQQAQFNHPAAQGLVQGLTPGTTYHFILTATNFTGLTSAPTLERSARAEVFQGVNPPSMVAGLEVIHSTVFSDAVELRWNEPATDIYGGPTAVASYKVYRGTTPNFIPGPSNLVGTLSGASSTVLHDRNAWTDAADYYYLVTAMDVQGFASGAGRELPVGISDLQVSLGPPGMLSLIWSEVTQDVVGEPTAIDRYEVYVDTQPISRSRIDLLVPALTTTAPSAQIPEGTGTRYISVIVVDVRGNKSPF